MAKLLSLSEQARLAAPARAFVRFPTPEPWLAAAAANLPELLTDHANCERKAAATALALMARHPEQRELALQLSKLAREELRHFEQVLAQMERLGLPFGPLSASRYAGGLMAEVRSGGQERLVDTLLVGAVVEARSCERFAALVPVLPQPLSGFYSGLLASEARHFEVYLSHARRIGGDVDCRIDALVEVDNRLISSPDPELRFHSGQPQPSEDARHASGG